MKVEIETHDTERRLKRAASIAAMGLVEREADFFNVYTPSLRGKQARYKVYRDFNNFKIKCDCLEFDEEFSKDQAFRCEHILAVKEALLRKTLRVKV